VLHRVLLQSTRLRPNQHSTFGATENKGVEMNDVGCICIGLKKVNVKVKADIALHGNPISEIRDVTCHMGITQCYLPPGTSERAPPNSSHALSYLR